jgi:hypothetical protein
LIEGIDSSFSNFLEFIMSNCARPDCQIAAKSSCCGCGREQYCGSVCQKLDWKAHKSMCATSKKLPNKLSYDETVRIINEILASNKGNEIKVLEHLLSHADNQFGQQVAERAYPPRTGVRRAFPLTSYPLIFWEFLPSSLSTLQRMPGACSFHREEVDRANYQAWVFILLASSNNNNLFIVPDLQIFLRALRVHRKYFQRRYLISKHSRGFTTSMAYYTTNIKR